MSENGDSRSADKPQKGRNRRSKETERDGNDQEAGVELRGCNTCISELKVSSLKPSNTPHATNDQEDDEQEQEVGEKRVDAEHHKQDSIVAGEVSEIVVDSALNFAKVLRLRESLDIEEFSKGFEVGEPGGQWHRTGLFSESTNVEPVCQQRQRYRNACHCGYR